MARGRKKEDISVIYDRYVKGKEPAVKAACRNGATDKDLAELLGCGKTTLQTIKREHEGFRDMVKKDKQVADLFVENALFKRACGFEYEEVSTEVLVNKDGSGTTTFVKKTKKQVAPETAAAMAWLKNRRPDLWRDRQDVNLTNDSAFVDALKALNDSYKSDG